MSEVLKVHESTVRKIEPSRWKRVQVGPCDEVHWAYVSIRYLGTRTSYEFLCGILPYDTALFEDAGQVNCVVCLSCEHAADDSEATGRRRPPPG